MTNNRNDIPSIIDGLSSDERKVLYTCLEAKGNEFRIRRLDNLVRYTTESYDSSFISTILHLSQNSIGSNNISILHATGHSLERRDERKDFDHHHSVYIKLNPLSEFIFCRLEPFISSSGDVVPEFYVPIIPIVLTNGAKRNRQYVVPNFNPNDVIKNILRRLGGEELAPMKPWFRNFKGSIEQLDKQNFVVKGNISVLEPGKLEITELPIQTSIRDYKKQTLDVMMCGSDKYPAIIRDYEEYHTENAVRFIVTVDKPELLKTSSDIHKMFKLQDTLSTSSMILLDSKNCIQEYSSPYNILEEFFDICLGCYEKQKNYTEGKLTAEHEMLDNQLRFINEVSEYKICIDNRKESEIIDILKDKGFKSDPIKLWRDSCKQELCDDVKNEKVIDVEPDYNYLINMNFLDLTMEQKIQLLNKYYMKKDELHKFKLKKPSDLWKDDLEHLLQEFDCLE